MNKLFTKIAGLFLGLTMAVGVGVAAISNNNDALQVSALTGTPTTLFDSSNVYQCSTTSKTTTDGAITFSHSANNT